MAHASSDPKLLVGCLVVFGGIFVTAIAGGIWTYFDNQRTAELLKTTDLPAGVVAAWDDWLEQTVAQRIRPGPASSWHIETIPGGHGTAIVRPDQRVIACEFGFIEAEFGDVSVSLLQRYGEGVPAMEPEIWNSPAGRELYDHLCIRAAEILNRMAAQP